MMMPPQINMGFNPMANQPMFSNPQQMMGLPNNPLGLNLNMPKSVPAQVQEQPLEVKIFYSMLVDFLVKGCKLAHCQQG
jgi:hypothetical protein